MNLPRFFYTSSRLCRALPRATAALLLLIWLVAGLERIARRPMSAREFDYARCGRELWEGASQPDGRQPDGRLTSCGNLPGGALAYRAAGLPLTVDLLLEARLDRWRSPGKRLYADDSAPGAALQLSSWELRHRQPLAPLLLRLPFLLTGLALGAALWWVTRRQFGNRAGALALAFYCFTPELFAASLEPGAAIPAAFGLFGSLYTTLGVAHALRGPRAKWPPRIVLLAALLGFTGAAQPMALVAALVVGLALALWVGEEHRALLAAIVAGCALVALGLELATYSFSVAAWRVAQSSAWHQLIAAPTAACGTALHFFAAGAHLGLTLATIAALALYVSARRSRFFGNSAPLIAAAVLLSFGATLAGALWLWALPFLFAFLGGLWADAFESRHTRLAEGAALTLVLLQAFFFFRSLSV